MYDNCKVLLISDNTDLVNSLFGVVLKCFALHGKRVKLFRQSTFSGPTEVDVLIIDDKSMDMIRLLRIYTDRLQKRPSCPVVFYVCSDSLENVPRSPDNKIHVVLLPELHDVISEFLASVP